MHVAAVNGQTEALVLFLETNPLAVREATTSGETVLHLCVKNYQAEAVRVLIENMNEVDELLSSQDNSGRTALRLAAAAKQTQVIHMGLNLLLLHP